MRNLFSHYFNRLRCLADKFADLTVGDLERRRHLVAGPVDVETCLLVEISLTCRMFVSTQISGKIVFSAPVGMLKSTQS
jgi:hypothetical protein